jgi:predicted ATP-grasp superfamily ATP-dependent carboligase
MAQKDPTIVYITRDIERALGTTPVADYRIITNRTPYSEIVAHLYPAYITLIESKELLDTAELLEHEVTLETLSHLDADIVVFKNNTRVEEIAKKHGWNLLNPSAALAEKVENKLTQIEWLGKMADQFLPPHKVISAKDIQWEKRPFIIQWAHGHTGDSTILINSEKELKDVQTKFPERTTRVTEFLNGPSFTVNVVVAPEAILVGNISYQITGMKPFTTHTFTTIGNDWSASATLLDEDELDEIKNMATQIGKKLRGDGWKGLFGLDVLKDEEHNKIFLIEINARQPASTTYESQLQNTNRESGLSGQTTFEAHLDGLQDKKSSADLIEINDGAQIIQRVTETTKNISAKNKSFLADAGYILIEYTNTDENADLLRIQSARGIMESHNKFNSRGKEISDTLQS